MENQPENNELHSKSGMSAWKQSNTLKTEQLQQGDPCLNGTGQKKKAPRKVSNQGAKVILESYGTNFSYNPSKNFMFPVKHGQNT